MSSVNRPDRLTVLALNSGSSSLKFGLYDAGAEGIVALIEGELQSVDALPSLLAKAVLPKPEAIGHRIVHGGPHLRQHGVIDDGVRRQIEAATDFAPLHTPAALALMDRASLLFPGLPQVACFDTAFHATLPDTARTLPLPLELRAKGLQRYGFHGLSCESIVHRLAADLPHGLPQRVLIAHLGNGASVTAVRDGRSIDTSMGLTPAGGLLMGTRSGDVDPGLMIHLLRHEGFDADALETLLDHRSGMRGLSGLSSDMRALREAAALNPAAQLAVQMFCISAAKQLAAMITVLGGVDLIAFSGGIGENDAVVRAAICDRLAWFGIALDAPRNLRTHAAANVAIHDAESRCAIHVIASREDEQIARHAYRLLRPPPSMRHDATGAGTQR